MSCAYSTNAHMHASNADASTTASAGQVLSGNPRGTVQDRIQELERLVVALMQQQQQQQQQSVPSTPDPPGMGRLALPAPASSSSSGAAPECVPLSPSADLGRISPDGVSYVGGVHWAAVLDSIAELKDQFDKDLDDPHGLAATEEELALGSPVTGPMLLYGSPKRATHEEILASVPPRPVVDRLISKYFNVLDMAPALLHSGRFLRQYERFWQDPSAAPIVWVGLLFTMMCLAAQAQPAAASEPPTMVKPFRDRAVQCLVLGGYTKAGPFVLETLILYLAVEHYLCEDAEFGVYLLLGVIVHLAMRMGYHRDPRHFAGIRPFEGEIRRRVWATIYQVDLGISAQMGLPRMIKERQMDTEPPRNLFDYDLDEAASQLPPSRPDTEVTPMLYVLAKNRVASVGGAICDLVADIRPGPYDEVMRLDQSLLQARQSLPPSLAWRPLAQSITCSGQTILQRMWLEINLLRLQIILHKRYCIGPDRPGEPYPYSKNACLNAAIKILEFQCLVDDETQPDGQLHQVRWRVSSLLNHHFLLATSVLCSLMRDGHRPPDETLNAATGAEVRQLLSKSLNVWLRSSASSKEAKKAARALRVVLQSEDPDSHSPKTPSTQVSESMVSGPEPDFSVAFYAQGYLRDIEFPLDFESMTFDGLETEAGGLAPASFYNADSAAMY